MLAYFRPIKKKAYETPKHSQKWKIGSFSQLSEHTCLIDTQTCTSTRGPQEVLSCMFTIIHFTQVHQCQFCTLESHADCHRSRSGISKHGHVRQNFLRPTRTWKDHPRVLPHTFSLLCKCTITFLSTAHFIHKLQHITCFFVRVQECLCRYEGTEVSDMSKLLTHLCLTKQKKELLFATGASVICKNIRI